MRGKNFFEHAQSALDRAGHIARHAQHAAQALGYRGATTQTQQWFFDEVMQRARWGVPPFESADALAQKICAANTTANVETLLDALVRREVKVSFSAGFIGGIATTLVAPIAAPIAVPASMAATLLVQARMVMAMAVLCGHNLDDPWTLALVAMAIGGGQAPEPLKRAGVYTSQWAATNVFLKGAQKRLPSIYARAGQSLKESAKKAPRLGAMRFVPVLGALVAAGVDVYGCRKVAGRARQMLLKNKMLPPRP